MVCSICKKTIIVTQQEKLELASIPAECLMCLPCAKELLRTALADAYLWANRN